MAKIKPSLTVLRDNNGRRVTCPRCRYDCVRVIKSGGLPPGINPHSLTLECGRCAKPFYVFVD